MQTEVGPNDPTHPRHESNYFYYPLRIYPRFGAALIVQAVMPRVIFMRTQYQGCWQCVSCAEAGREWYGSDKEAHAEAHQVGLDYAISLIRRNPDLL